MIIPVWPLLFLVCAAGAARAEVYRCTANGKTVYTDVPCQPGAVPAELPPLTPIDRQPTRTPLTEQFDANAKREAETKRAAAAEWSKNYATKKAHDDAVRRAVIEHRAVRGMTPAEVRNALGEPSRIDGAGTPAERWIYQNGRERRTLGFAAGVLKSERAGTSRR